MLNNGGGVFNGLGSIGNVVYDGNIDYGTIKDYTNLFVCSNGENLNKAGSTTTVLYNTYFTSNVGVLSYGLAGDPINYFIPYVENATRLCMNATNIRNVAIIEAGAPQILGGATDIEALANDIKNIIVAPLRSAGYEVIMATHPIPVGGNHATELGLLNEMFVGMADGVLRVDTLFKDADGNTISGLMANTTTCKYSTKGAQVVSQAIHDLITS
jgi:hypothetical protein